MSKKIVRNDNMEDNSELEFDIHIDKPKEVLATYYNTHQMKHYFKVSFYQRTNGIIPATKLYSSDFMRENFPYFFIDYLEKNSINL